MRCALVLVGLILLAGCESVPPSLSGLPVDVTRNSAVTAPVSSRSFSLTLIGEHDTYPASTEAGQKAIVKALTERGWTEDSTHPISRVEWDWGLEPRQTSTEWGWADPGLNPIGLYYPYGFSGPYGPFITPSPMVTVTRTHYPVWLNVTIRDTAAPAAAAPLFEGKISTDLGYPGYADYLPLLVERLFDGVLKTGTATATDRKEGSAPQ